MASYSYCAVYHYSPSTDLTLYLQIQWFGGNWCNVSAPSLLRYNFIRWLSCSKFWLTRIIAECRQNRWYTLVPMLSKRFFSNEKYGLSWASPIPDTVCSLYISQSGYSHQNGAEHQFGGAFFRHFWKGWSKPALIITQFLICSHYHTIRFLICSHYHTIRKFCWWRWA